MALIKGVCISTRRKASADRVHECRAHLKGLEKDVHFGMGEKQVSMLPMEKVSAYFSGLGEAVSYGRFGENLVIDGLCWEELQVGDRLLADGVMMEIVKIGAGGPASDAYQGEKVCTPMEAYFVFCKIQKEGVLREGSTIEKEKKDEMH